MTRHNPAPLLYDLARAPECAALSILEHALRITSFALLAVNPALGDEEFRRQLDRRELLAELILKQVDVLQGALQRYRDIAVGAARYATTDIVSDPF